MAFVSTEAADQLMMILIWHSLQDFLKDKNITLGEGEMLCLPPVWEWSQQLFIKDQALFNNPIYVGKGARNVHNGAVKSFRRTKVSGTGVPVNEALLV